MGSAQLQDEHIEAKEDRGERGHGETEGVFLSSTD